MTDKAEGKMEHLGQQVTLKVHLMGLIAYVPSADKLWALFPNGISASPAPWSATTESIYLRARSPHFALLITDRGSIDDDNTTAKVYTSFEPFKSSDFPTSLYPQTTSEKVVSLILNSGLNFNFESSPLKIKKKVRKFFPKMQTVAPLHSAVDSKFNPDVDGFAWRALSTALPLNTGTLSAKGFFGISGKEKVEFGRVMVNASHKLEFDGRVWRKRLANQLVWKVRLPAGVRSVTLESLVWKDGTKKYYTLKPVGDSNLIELAIINSEIEVPTLFLEDAILEDQISGFPDPDFGLLYDLSVNQGQLDQRRFPVPSASTGAGKLTKTCAGGMFAGFAK